VGGVVRVLTANLWNGGADPDEFAALVEACGADVVCAQELAPEQADALSRVLPHGALAPARDNTGMGIALRRPAALDRVELPHRDAHVARLDPVEWPELGAALEVIGVHILGPHVWPPWRAWPLRRGQLRALERYLAGDPERPRLLVGDLNATPLFRVYRRLAAHLRDVHREAARRRGARPASTWGPTPGWPRLLRIDHALAAGVEVEDVRVVAVPGADHSAVLVQLHGRSAR
jgi:endonuclease/exonuclease/phosphatase (EEP) superfamily protein YafD